MLTVKVWGIVFTVNTSGTNFDGRAKDLSLYKVGDSVDIKGDIDVAASTPTINARSIKNQTFKENRENEKKSENSSKNKKKDSGRN